jgi:hypothetical protein
MAEGARGGRNGTAARKALSVGAAVTLLAGGVIAALERGGSRAFAQDRAKPAVSLPAVIQAQSAASTVLPIRVGPADLLPRQAFLRVRGLPAPAALSEGHSIAPGTWAVPLSALPRLRLSVPSGVQGKWELAVLLLAVDGSLLHEAKSTLLIVTGEAPPPPAASPKASTLRVQPDGPPVPLIERPPLADGDRALAVKMLQRGNELLANKDFSAAQHFYQRAADIGLPEAALALARTFDPGELKRSGAIGVRADPERARVWYEKARALGSPEAEEYLLRLSAMR